MSEKIKGKIGIYREVFRNLFNLFIVTVSGSFALLTRDIKSSLALIGLGTSV